MPLTPTMKQKLTRTLYANRVAVVGASPEQLSIGMGPVYNLLSSGFEGEVFPVNPKYDKILGQKCYPDIESINPPPDLAILMLNQHLALEMTERAGRHGVGGVSIVVGGFSEVGPDGEALNERLKEISRLYEMPVVGPNTLGFCSLHRGLNGIFWHFDGHPGSVAVLSQSGGVGLTIAHCLRTIHCGLSHFIGVGNRTVLDFPDYLELLRTDSDARVFALFIEGVSNPRALYDAVKETARSKPVVVYKAGKNEVVSRATATHTGSLTGEYRLYRGMFRQAGAFEAGSAMEAAIAAKSLSMVGVPHGNRLCALTFTAGPCITAMDRLVEAGWELPGLSMDLKKRIFSIIGEKTPVEIQNPVDLTGPGFLARNYVPVMEAVLAENFDAYMFVWSYSPLMRVPVVEFTRLLRSFGSSSVVVLLGNPEETAPHVKELTAGGVCTLTTSEDAAIALNAVLARRRFLDREAN